MRIENFVEEKVKSYRFNLKDLKDYLVLDFKIDSDRPYLCFFFLVDPDGVLRAQFEGRKREEKIFIGKDNGSIGTYPGALKEGEWTLYFTNYGLIEDENEREINFVLEIDTYDNLDINEFTLIGEEKWVEYPALKPGLSLNFDGEKKKLSEQRWYRGDFHTHTTLSDCHMTPKEAAEYCESHGIDFMFLTEHNLIHTGFERSKTLFIPGIEVTLLKGHLLVYGLREFIDCFSYKNFDWEYMNDVINKVKGSGGLINVAHPMMVPWDWRFMEIQLSDIDMIEIVNCPNWHTSENDNRKAIELIDILWNEGFRITGVGGSDNHLKPHEKYDGYIGPSLYSDPATYVYSDGLSEKAIFESLKRGKVYVSRGVKLNVNIFSAENKYYLPGDEIEEDNFTYNVDIIENNHNDILNVFLVLNGKIESERKIKGVGSVEFNISLRKEDYNWARIGINDKNGKFVAYINPVYKGKKSSNLLYWKHLLEKYNQIFRKK